MIWLALALGTALSEGVKDILMNEDRVKPITPIAKAWVLAVVMFPLSGAVLFVTGMPEVDPAFWEIVAVHGVLMTVANVFYMRALALGTLGQTQPILALTTLFLTVTTPIMTNDRVTFWGWAGVVVVTVGILATQHPGRDPKTGRLPGPHAALLEMWRAPGVGSKLVTAGIFAFTANLDKLALNTGASPALYLTADYAIGVVLLTLLLVFYKMKGTRLVGEPVVDKRTGLAVPIASVAFLFAIGLVNVCTIFLHMWALGFVAVPFVIAVKRNSIIVASMWSFFVKKDRKPHWYRVVGIVLVVLGIGLMLLLGKATGGG